MFTLSQVKTLYPRSGANCARTGRIPIEFYTQYQAEFNKICRENNLRAIFRGPRPDGSRQTMTRKEDAVAVMLYMR